MWTSVVNIILSYPCILERTLHNHTFHHWQILDRQWRKGEDLGAEGCSAVGVLGLLLWGHSEAEHHGRGGVIEQGCSPHVGQEIEGDRKGWESGWICQSILLGICLLQAGSTCRFLPLPNSTIQLLVHEWMPSLLMSSEPS